MIASTALAVLVLVLSQVMAPPPELPPGSRVLPRIGRAPTTPRELLRTLGVGSIIWYACFASAPLFVWMSRRAVLARRWPLAVAAHVVVVPILAAITAWLQFRFSYRGSPMAPPLGAYLKLGVITGILPFLTVAAAAQALEARARAHQRDLEAARMRSQLAESRLEALTAQLQPHFLFNTLQGISTLITRDPPAADAMLASLSDLLREVLRRGDTREVELAEELRVLEPYLDISRRRFGERLSVEVNAHDGVGRGLVPFFILQPLVENALHHGISSHAGKGSVRIAATRVGATLRLEVSDDGPGTASPDEHRGIGLTNARARLRELYGDAQSLELARPREGGFRVTVTLPYHETA